MPDVMRLSLLGHFSVTRNGEIVTGFESNKVRGLLAYLSVEQDRPHSRAALTGLLWPDWPEQSARRNLSQALFNLRQTLGEGNTPTPFLLISHQDIGWNPAAPVWFDLRACLDALPGSQPAVDLSIAQQLASLYRGPLLEQFVLEDSDIFQNWLLAKREWLHSQVMAGLQRYAQAFLESGPTHFDSAQTLISRQLALEPWREEAHVQMMQLLAAQGQRSAALSQFELCRRLLAEELAAEPGSVTVALYQQLRDGIWLPPASQPAVPILPIGLPQQEQIAPPSRFYNLPTPPSPLVGREEMLAQITDLLHQPTCRLLTLIGPGGIGKTHLAMEAARSADALFVAGLCFVALADSEPLAAEASDLYLIQAIASALQLNFEGNAPPLAQLQAFLRDRSLLLLLDNFEPLIESAPLVAELLTAAPWLKIVTTSRERLNLAEEWLLPVERLTVPDLTENGGGTALAHLEAYSAVRLFCQCARRVQPNFQLGADNGSAVAQICQQVDGLPLALTLAATWVRHLSCQEIVTEIGRTVDFLTTAQRNTPARHRSMRAVFDYSWQLLSDEEQIALARLAVFPQSFSRTAAQEIAGATLWTLSALVDSSLLRRGSDGRYELHPLLRQFAGERLQLRPDLARQVQQSHAEWYGEWLHGYLPGLSGNGQSAALAAVEAETENIRAGWHWVVQSLSPSLLGRYTPALFHFYNLRGWYREGAQLFEEAIDRLRSDAPEDGSAALAALLIHLAQFYHRLSRLDAAQALLSEAMPLVRAQNRPGELGFALNALGLNAYMRGEYGEAQTPLEEALAHFRQVNEPAGIASVLNNLGNLAAAVDTAENYAAARSFYSEAIGVARSTDNLQELARALINLGTVEHVGHLYPLAQIYYQEGIAAAAAIGSRRLQAIGLTNLGEILVQTHDLPAAQQVLEQALALKQTLSDARGLVYTLNALAGIEKELGNRAAARQRWIEAARSGLSSQALSPALDAALELAQLLAEENETNGEGRVEAIQLALAVLAHPASEAYVRNEAQALLDRPALRPTDEERRMWEAKVLIRGMGGLLADLFGGV